MKGLYCFYCLYLLTSTHPLPFCYQQSIMTEVDNSKSADLETNATAFVQPQEPTNFVLYRAPAVQSSSTSERKWDNALITW
jgi:hypothetical protein